MMELVNISSLGLFDLKVLSVQFGFTLFILKFYYINIIFIYYNIFLIHITTICCRLMVSRKPLKFRYKCSNHFNIKLFFTKEVMMVVVQW